MLKRHTQTRREREHEKERKSKKQACSRAQVLHAVTLHKTLEHNFLNVIEAKTNQKINTMLFKFSESYYLYALAFALALILILFVLCAEWKCFVFFFIRKLCASNYKCMRAKWCDEHADWLMPMPMNIIKTNGVPREKAHTKQQYTHTQKEKAIQQLQRVNNLIYWYTWLVR